MARKKERVYHKSVRESDARGISLSLLVIGSYPFFRFVAMCLVFFFSCTIRGGARVQQEMIMIQKKSVDSKLSLGHFSVSMSLSVGWCDLERMGRKRVVCLDH